jgi:MtN3 and saliva related transmembrane protein
MSTIEPQWLGYLAATLTTGSFVPQAWHTFRSSNLAGISVGMYSAFTFGVALWLGYGLLLGEWPIIIANAITLALAATILGRTLQARRAAARLPV